MLFRKDIEPRCAYCAKGTAVNDREVACPRRGVVAAEYYCLWFKYDPLKRVPPRPVKLDTAGFREEDFQL